MKRYDKHGNDEDYFYTDRNFWDCGCSGNDYIRSRKEKKCKKCGAVRDESADSRPLEVTINLGVKYPKKYLRVYSVRLQKYVPATMNE